MYTHPLDISLNYPFTKYDILPPKEALKELYEEYIEGRQDYDPTTNTLYRKFKPNYKIDAVSSHYTEHIRAIDCHINNKDNLYDAWKKLSPDVIRKFKTNDELWDYLSGVLKAKDCNYFPAGLCIRLYLGFRDTRNPIKIIDPSAGWGCRMLTAIACGPHVELYHGYDPNPNLIEPYKKIIEELDVDKKCKVFSEYFDKASVLKRYYDLGVTSPPYYDLEVYFEDIPLTYEEWIDNMYSKYLRNLYESVKINGKIIIYVSDYFDVKTRKTIPLAQDTVKILKSFGCKLLVTGNYTNERPPNDGKYPRPFFVFRVL